MRPFSLLILGLVALAGLIASPTGVQAQSQFSAVARVNDRAITGFELEQRILMNELLQTPGDLQKESLTQLIEDRLKLDAAAVAGITVSDEQIDAGMTEFAGRANLTKEQFVQALNQGGVQETTFRDFVKAGLLWREIVRTRFVSRVQISEEEVDRAVALSSSVGGVRVLLSEIILPADTPENAAASQGLLGRITKIQSYSEFARAAREVSVSPTRDRGGRLDWLPMANLPPAIRPLILALRPGEVSAPVPLPNAIAIFQMRAIEETSAPKTDIAAIEYATFYIPGGRSQEALTAASKIRARVDTCDDLYGVAKGLEPERLDIKSLPVAEIPQDVALELAKLDAGEVSTTLTTANGTSLMFLMMCGRTPALGENVSREEVRASLVNQRFASYASGYLAELRADAVITTK